MTIDLWLNGYLPPSLNRQLGQHFWQNVKMKKDAKRALMGALLSKLRDAQRVSSTPTTSEEASNISLMQSAAQNLSLTMIPPRSSSKSAKSKLPGAKRSGRTSGSPEPDLFD